MKRNSRGFTLTELAIVTVVVGLLLGGLTMTLATQIDLRKYADTQRTLELARDALVGYAIASGRLPCPATAASSGAEAPLGGGTCTVFTVAQAGYLPAVTLGLTPIDSQGYLLDAWGSRVRYSVTAANAAAFTTTNQIKIQTPSSLSPDLRVCSTSTGMTTGASAVCAANKSLTTDAVAVLYSLGRNYASGGTGADEAKNIDNDRAFISHEIAPAGATNGEFDDLVTWLSKNVLYNRLVAAGAI